MSLLRKYSLVFVFLMCLSGCQCEYHSKTTSKYETEQIAYSLGYKASQVGQSNIISNPYSNSYQLNLHAAFEEGWLDSEIIKKQQSKP